MFGKLRGKGLKYNIEKYYFGQTEMEYLFFWVKHDGVKPIRKKNRSNNQYEATYFLKISTDFICVITYYCHVSAFN